MLGKLFSKFLSFICSYIPTTNWIAFSSFPDFTDNAFAMYKYLLQNHYNRKFCFYWLFVDKSIIKEYHEQLLSEDSSISIVYKYSLKGLWVYIRARYVFETHGIFHFLNLRQHPDKHISLWHGMPLKLLGGSIGEVSSPNMNYTIATSVKYQEIMAEAFGVKTDRVILSGQPRCDLQFVTTDWFNEAHIDRSKYNRVGIWMPTYRKAIIGDPRVDGDYKDGSIAFISIDELDSLDEYLSSINTLLIIKIHPMDVLVKYNFKLFTNIVVIKPSLFKSQLYPLLGSCDFLLTDYSSVFIDYQITNKAMAFVMNDINSYKNSRGLYFSNLSEILPGPIIDNIHDLRKFIAAPYVTNRSEKIFNEYFDNLAADRIAKYLRMNVSI